ncbi:peptidase M23 [Ketogulonicigenium robustum]|uniref:Peptidase M23 n=1 Tax=Ketogulonicigenium robustum TaxID=92947 RepID=A0A1W6NZ92_9RHOB|nr:M23 family metallopeptidase [Ketogulonicigenium robustum]ARO14463.1 peptidase M23 [Ketogulonicigenium robustum]
MRLTGLFYTALAGQMAATVPVLADDLADGAQIAAAFVAGDTDQIWAAATPDMQQAFGSAKDLAAWRTSLGTEFGTEEEVIDEQTAESGGFTVYSRVARWSDTPDPMEIVISLDEGQKIAGFVMRPQPVAANSAQMDYETQANLRLPFDGPWFVYWGGRDIADNYHAADPVQRFAMDFLVQQDGQSYAGDASILANYYCWGQPILAPANGTVVAAEGGWPDQPIGETDPVNPLGNHVVIDMGNGEFVFLAHLQQDSLTVSEGDTISARQQVGRCGNSGNSTEPHLHMHMQNDPTFGQGEGLPAQFNRYTADGETGLQGEVRKGQTVQQD